MTPLELERMRVTLWMQVYVACMQAKDYDEAEDRAAAAIDDFDERWQRLLVSKD